MAKPVRDNSALGKTYRQVRADRSLKRIVPIIMSCISVLVVLVYVVSVMYTRFGNFTVSINRFHYLQYGLSLSETKDFKDGGTSSLNCRASEIITNIEGSSLDDKDLGVHDGEDSGENYLCYTFYCKNTGQESVSFDYSIVATEMTMGIEKAVRIRLITTLRGETKKVDYARANGVDPETQEPIPEEGTTPFRTKNTVMLDTVNDFVPDEIMKITVVIWLEGPDNDCVDEIIGGEFKIDMKFSIAGISEAETEQ